MSARQAFEVMPGVPEELVRLLKKHGYHMVGRHSAVKRCHWLYASLTSGRFCYKQRFYGINSHRCIQMSPTVNFCDHDCVFCWRERNNSRELQPAPEFFYLKVLEEAREGDFKELLPRIEDIYSMRLNKLLALAAKRVSPRMIENITQEERFLYQAILAIVEEWFRFVGAWGGEKG